MLKISTIYLFQYDYIVIFYQCFLVFCAAVMFNCNYFPRIFHDQDSQLLFISMATYIAIAVIIFSCSHTYIVETFISKIFSNMAEYRYPSSSFHCH